MIQVQNVTKSFGNAQILKDATLTIEKGDFVAIMGKSGSGKSTLLNLIGGMDKPDSGTVSVGGITVSSANDATLTRFRRNHVGFVFQFFNLLPNLTARENVRIPLLLDGKANENGIADLFETVALTHRIDAYPSELSGGEQQRVAIARALVLNPSLLLADEPTGSLDAETGKAIMNTLRALNEGGKTILLATHDKDVAQYARRILVIENGTISEVKR